jgi:putative phosphonate metabolism protein
MTETPRFAIYYAPDANTALARFGSKMLGYDAFNGDDLAFPADVVTQAADWQADWHDITADPRKYGFHATLKAPFPLADDMDEALLRESCAQFASIARPIPVIAPVVRSLDGFTAIVPATPSLVLNTLAQNCVEAFDGFRAPMTPADRARRKPERLTARQVAQLDRWGYPYVGDDFRFHMTLTGRLPPERRDAVAAMLQRHFAALDLMSLAIDRIALFRQDTPASRFRVIESFALRGL